MASIIEKYASQDVTLLQNPVIADGKTTYKTRIEAKAIVSEFKEADEQYFGKIRNGITFYIAPLDDPPLLPGKIIPARNVCGRQEGKCRIFCGRH